MVVKMFVEVDQVDFLLAKPTKGISSRTVPPLRPPVLVFHVPQHRKFVQMTKIDALWTGHLFRPLVDHPEHLVVGGGVRGSMALEVRAGHNLPTDVVLLAAPDLAKLWSHTVGFVVLWCCPSLLVLWTCPQLSIGQIACLPSLMMFHMPLGTVFFFSTPSGSMSNPRSIKLFALFFIAFKSSRLAQV